VRSLTELRKETLAGVLGPIIGLIFVLLAIALAPSFNWETDALSDLGHWFRTDIGDYPIPRALIFNSGLIVSGTLTMYFALTLIRDVNDTFLRFALLSIVVTGIFLIGVGIFYEAIDDLHTLSALGYFLTIPVANALIGIAFVRHKETRWMGILFLVLSLIAVSLFRPWTSLAVWEYVMALISVVGIILISIANQIGILDFIKAA
jgi:hypothetical membrane protein